MKMEKPVIRPRKRNALGAGRVARIKPQVASEHTQAHKTRPAAISKAFYQKSPEDFYAPWDQASRDEHAPEDTRRNYIRLQKALLVAALMLGIFDSGGLLSWVRGLPAGPIEDRIIVSVETWHGWMEDRGLSDYLARVRKYVQSLKEKGWQGF